ncbi:unnamed protein product [[Candida] boidinii]|uniref:Unnamed protein product n=1 Tax=Candida boidinii TaxID=5477 RepID=A0A9W6T168_CANBO|nr:unnamed protein product [[Candida] boidinii]
MSTLTSQNSNPASRIDIDSKLGIEPQLPELKLKKYAPISNSNSTFQLFSTPKSFVNSSTPLENIDFKLTGNANNNTNITNITNNNGNSLTSHVPSAPSSISSAGSSNLSYKKRSRGSDNSFQQRDSSVESAHNPLKNGDNRTHSSLTSLKQRIKQHNLNEQQQQQQQQQPDELKNSNSTIDKIPSYNIHKQKSHSLIEERKLNKQRKLIEKQRKQKSLDLSSLLKPKQSQNNNNSNNNNNNNNNISNNNSPKSLNKNNEDDPGIGLLQETQEATSTLLNARKKLMNDLNIDSIVYQQRVNAICDTKTCDNLDLVDAHDNSSALLNTDQVDLSNSYHGFDDSMADESGDFMSLHHSTSIKKIDSSSTNETPSRVSSSMLKSGTSSNRFNDSNITTNSRTDSMGMAHSNSFMVNLGSSLQNEAHRYDSITSRFLHNQNNKDSTTTESPDTAAQYKKVKISHSTRDRAERVDNFIRKYYSSLDKYINSGRIQNGEKEFKHPGVEGVFNPLQIIRNRRVRRKHKERFKDSILTDIPLPSQVFSKYDEQRLIWQINLQEYLDDISWREFHWNELKDHNNKLWFPKSSDKKKSHIHRHSDHQKHQHRDKYKAYIKDKLYGDNNEKEYRMHEQLFAYNKSNPMSPNSSNNSNNNNNNGTAPNISMNDSNNFNNNEYDNNNNIKLPSISISHLNRHNVDDNEDLADDDEYLDTMYNNYNYELDGANIIDDNNTNDLNALQGNNGSFTSSKFSSVVAPGSAANSSKTDQQQQQQQQQERTHSNLHSKFKKLSKSPVRLLAGMKSKDDVRLRSSSIATSSPEETMISEIPSLLGPDNAQSRMAFDNNERGRNSNDLKIPIMQKQWLK